MDYQTTAPRISLKAARINANLSLVEASKSLNISKDTLSNYEKGITAPTWDIVEKIGDLYKYPIELIKFTSKSD